MTPTLSQELDEARQMEAHYRGLLLFWKKRRQRLEAKIPDDYNHLWQQIDNLVDGAWTDGDRPATNQG